MSPHCPIHRPCIFAAEWIISNAKRWMLEKQKRSYAHFHPDPKWSLNKSTICPFFSFLPLAALCSRCFDCVQSPMCIYMSSWPQTNSRLVCSAYSKSAFCSSWICFSRDGCTRWSLRSLPTPAILRFGVITTAFPAFLSTNHVLEAFSLGRKV